MADRLNAADVLDVGNLRQIARPHDLAGTTDPRTALEIFAYQFTEAADAEEQDKILKELLVRMTAGHSKEKNREVLRYLAGKFKTHVHLMTEFAKQEGIFI
jgi:hypothetical protein